MTGPELDATYRSLGQQLHEGHMRRLGIEPTQRIARIYNHARYAAEHAWRNRLYTDRFAELLAENGALTRPALTLHDGWAIDTSQSLPHLDRVLAQADEILKERSGVRTSGQNAYRSYFQNVFTRDDAVTWPAFMDFATSSDLLATVGAYLKTVPALSTTLPAGIRLVESSRDFDDQPDNPHDSQLYHIDYYSLPNVYVLVLVEDTELDQGPWTFLPRKTSQRVRAANNYWQHGCDYRLSDEQVFAVANPEEQISFSYPRGTVLFIESSGCMHFGSRNAIRPRFQLMFGYTGACRTDFSELAMCPQTWPYKEEDPLLRRLVADKYLQPPAYQQNLNAQDLDAVRREMEAAEQALT